MQSLSTKTIVVVPFSVEFHAMYSQCFSAYDICITVYMRIWISIAIVNFVFPNTPPQYR